MCEIVAVNNNNITNNVPVEHHTNGKDVINHPLETHESTWEAKDKCPKTQLTRINNEPDEKTYALNLETVNDKHSFPMLKITEKQMAVLGLRKEEDAKTHTCATCDVDVVRYILKLCSNTGSFKKD